MCKYFNKFRRELVLWYYVITFEITFYLHFQCHIHSRNRIFYRIRNTCHTCRIHSNITVVTNRICVSA